MKMVTYYVHLLHLYLHFLKQLWNISRMLNTHISILQYTFYYHKMYIITIK